MIVFSADSGALHTVGIGLWAAVYSGSDASTDLSFGCAHGLGTYQPGASALGSYQPNATRIGDYSPGSSALSDAC